MSIFKDLVEFLFSKNNQKESKKNKKEPLAYEVKTTTEEPVHSENEVDTIDDCDDPKAEMWKNASRYTHKRYLKGKKRSRMKIRSMENEARRYGRHDIARLYRKKRR